VIQLAMIVSGQRADSSKFKILFNLGVGAVTTEYYSNKIVIDEPIAQQRARFPVNSYYTGELTDQPHEHGAMFTNFSAKASFREGYDFYTNLLLEYRGQSYGANDLNNAVVFPQFYGRLADSIQLGAHPLAISLHIGDLFQYRLNQGLQVYNVDLQAVILNLQYRSLHFEVVHIPDHSRGIGVGMEELFSFNTGWAYRTHRFNFSFDLNSNFPFNLPEYSRTLPNRYYTHLSFDYKYQWNPNNYGYLQIGTRNIEGGFSAETAAALIGAQIETSLDKLQLQFNPEVRYYSRLYNLGYFTPDNFFRDNAISEHYANTVGRFLYPLKNYYYSFNQWAVFTEYQNQDVLGLSGNFKADYKINDKLGLLLELDYLGIGREKALFNYLFYTWNFYYQPMPGLYIRTLFTNKAMNLDAHYQTFYMLRTPSIGLEMRKVLTPVW
jgi:hypothetical protein